MTITPQIEQFMRLFILWSCPEEELVTYMRNKPGFNRIITKWINQGLDLDSEMDFFLDEFESELNNVAREKDKWLKEEIDIDKNTLLFKIKKDIKKQKSAFKKKYGNISDDDKKRITLKAKYTYITVCEGFGDYKGTVEIKFQDVDLYADMYSLFHIVYGHYVRDEKLGLKPVGKTLFTGFNDLFDVFEVIKSIITILDFSEKPFAKLDFEPNDRSPDLVIYYFNYLDTDYAFYGEKKEDNRIYIKSFYVVEVGSRDMSKMEQMELTSITDKLSFYRCRNNL
jgi:uncharacterized protein YjbJ (UPF0337 family)